MPRSPAYRTAEKLLILTASAQEAIERGSILEFNEVMDMRQAALDELSNVAIDEDAGFLMAKVKSQNQSLIASIEKSQQATLTQLAEQFREARGVKAYRPERGTGGFQRVG